jgi:dCTP deaminase
MILPADSIAKLCDATLRYPMLVPFHDRTREHGVTFGLSSAGYDIRTEQDLDLPPSKFILASSIEYFNMPLNILGIVHDKSTWARCGIAVQNTVIEPGWRGYLTLEITNHGQEHVQVKAGSGIAQIIFHKLIHSADVYEGKYQDQPQGPVAAIMENTVPKGRNNPPKEAESDGHAEDHTAHRGLAQGGRPQSRSRLRGMQHGAVFDRGDSQG